MSNLSLKKISAAAVAVVLGLSAVSHAATLPYSTGFETTADSNGDTYATGNLVGQASWTYLASEPSGGASVVAPGLYSSGQAVKLQVSGQGGTSLAPVYSDYYNSSLAPTISLAPNTGTDLVTTVDINTALGSNGSHPSLAGVEILNAAGNPVASFYTGTGPDNAQDLIISDGNGGTMDAPGFFTAADGTPGTYTIQLDPTQGTYEVFFSNQAVSGPLSSTGLFSDEGPLSVAFASIDQGGGPSTATFDNLSVTSVVPEPASMAMIGLGGLLLLAKRPKRLA